MERKFPGQNGPFIGTINGGLGDGRGLNNNDWIDTVFTGLSGKEPRRQMLEWYL